MRGVGREHPRVAPSGRALLGNGVRDLHLLVDAELVGLVGPRVADHHVAALEKADLVACAGPVLLDEGSLLLQQSDDRVELRLRQLIRVGDVQTRVLLAEVQRRIGNLDRVAIHGDEPRVGLVVENAPARRRGSELGRVVQQRVGTPLQ